MSPQKPLPLSQFMYTSFNFGWFIEIFSDREAAWKFPMLEWGRAIFWDDKRKNPDWEHDFVRQRVTLPNLLNNATFYTLYAIVNL